MRPTRWLLLFPLAGVGCGESTRLSVNPAPSEVVVAQPTPRQVTDYEEFTGHTDAILSVQIKSRVTGYLEKKDFLDGQQVREGDILYEIDARPYAAALASAQATVAQGEAHKARVSADYKRAARLFERAAIGKQDFDLASSNFAEAEAQLGASKAQLETARLNMGFTKICAPMSGQLSRSLVDPGNLVRQEATLLNDIVASDKLYAYFDVSADAMERVKDVIDQGRVGGADGKEVPVEVGTSIDADRFEDAMKHLRDLKETWSKKLADIKLQKKLKAEVEAELTTAELESRKLIQAEETAVPAEFPVKGVVNFAENKLDAATGTLRVRGVIDNAVPAILSPGLFIRVRLPIGEPHPALLIPEDSIGSDQGRSFVYIVNSEDLIEYRPIVTGALYSGPAGSKLRAIKEGISAGDRFILSSETIRKVRPGAKVEPRLNLSEVAAAPPVSDRVAAQ